MKNHPLLPDDFYTMSAPKKRKYLEDVADKIRKDRTVMKPLTDDEKHRLRLRLQEAAIELHDLQSEYEEVKKQWRDNIDHQKDIVAETVSALKSGQESITGTTFEIRDYDNERVWTFFEDGSEVDSRPMLPDERQTTIHSSGMKKVE